MSAVSFIIITLILLLLIKGMSSNSSRSFKSEMVSLGVLGTFIGIASGLWYFDATDIGSSLPHLLSGLKVAFITSGVGIACAIFVSIFKPNMTHKTIDDLCRNQVEMTEQLRKSLETITEKNNDEFATALEGIVKDFNNNLTEQFGDNFKQLNSAVKEMVVWQENYKSQIHQYEKSLENVITRVEALAEIREEERDKIVGIIKALEQSSKEVNGSMRESTSIVKESLQLLLREANGKLR
jgi:biopolymer transport protein ExbB/TolQ